MSQEIKITANSQELQALLVLLNKGMRSGAYDLQDSAAITHWSSKIEKSAQDQQDQQDQQPKTKEK